MQVLQMKTRSLVFIASLLPSLLFSPSVVAEEFQIRDAQTVLDDSVYRLGASIDFTLSEKAQEALDNGVPLTFELEINVTRLRDYLWDETIASLEQRYELQYHALTKQYLVKNLNSGSQHSLPTMDAAITALGTIVDIPILQGDILFPPR